jgi:DeoR family transcriptional regulator of aga operon/DeoR family fructose operon transcriptional repressor
MFFERRNEILQKIKKQRTVKVSNLVEEYRVSIETIRRDLEYLEKKGEIRRVYGGAVVRGYYGEEPAYQNREIISYPQKQAIGRKVAEFIHDGDTLFVDVGTTTMEVAKNLKHKKNLTVITNATLVAQEMINCEGCRVILLGGELRRGELTVSGFMCDSNIQNFYANKAIIGIGGISIESGITDYYLPEVSTRRFMINRSDTVIGVADYSKFGVTSMNYICSLEDINILITDWLTPAKTAAEYRSLGIEVYIAPENLRG